VNDTSADSVRDAIAAGDYQRALDLWRAYTAAIAAAEPTWLSLTQAAELIAWSRPILQAARKDAGERLRALHVAGTYSRGRATAVNNGMGVSL
jgi:hypothetical protein